MVIGRPKDTGTDLEGEFSDSYLLAITLDTPEERYRCDLDTYRCDLDIDAGLFRSRLTAEDLRSAGWTALDPATWTRSINPLFIAVTEASYP